LGRKVSIRRLNILVLGSALLISLARLGAQAPGAPPPSLPDAQQVISYVNQTIEWYRHLAVEEELATDPADMIFFNDNRRLAKQITQLSLDFARAEAAYFARNSGGTASIPTQPGAPNRHQNLFQAAAKAEARVRSAQDEIRSLQQKLETTRGAAARRALQSQIEEVRSELDLAETRSQTLRSMIQFVGGKDVTGSGSLSAQIAELERSVPELDTTPGTGNDQAIAGAAAAASSSGSTNASTNSAERRRQAEPTGLLALITDLIALTRKMHRLDQAGKLTDALSQSAQKLTAPLVATLVAATQRGDVIEQQESTDPAVLEQQKRELDAITANFKQVSSVILPLGKQRILLDRYKSSLANWRAAVRSDYGAEARALLLRLSILGAVLIAFVALGDLWRRATFRYVSDPRRRHQVLLLRRMVLWFVITMIIAFSFASELGSLATFAGLITAGIAVALQNVILAVAGYFFLIGRYGVKVGDRVQISGVTGDVVDVGLIRLHLMELSGSGSDRQPTGRVVVFSNSIVFQPTASFFKQIPGTNFVWHEVTLTLAPQTDYHLAEERMLSAVEKVYAGYHERIEQQHRQMERSLNVSVAVPRPQSRVRLSQSGLEVVIRYPIELEKAAEIDDKITRELLDALEQRPRLKLVGSGTPNIQPVSDGTGGAEQPEPVVKVDKKTGR
jgi:small-conductance mechanosensitive channel